MDFSLVLILCLGFVRAEGSKIEILKPKAGDIWKKGSSVWVMWKEGEDGGPDKIDLDLYFGPGDGAIMENISFGVPMDTGSAEWTVKKDLPPGGDYFVKITSPTVKGFKVVSERFTIGRNSTKGQGNAAVSNTEGSVQLTMLVTLLVILLGVNCY
jgi:hypothetical protein